MALPAMMLARRLFGLTCPCSLAVQYRADRHDVGLRWLQLGPQVQCLLIQYLATNPSRCSCSRAEQILPYSVGYYITLEAR